MMNRIFFKLFAVLVFVAIGFSSFRAAADVGCLSSNTTYTYINEESNTTRKSHRRDRDDEYDDETEDGHLNRTFYHRYESDRSLTASNFCVTPITPTVACYIHSTRSGFTSSPGTLVNYSTVNNCNVPLDDNLPFLLISIAGVSMYFLRNRLVVI